VSAARAEAACHASVAADPFDWTAWNSEMDAHRDAAITSAARINAIDAEIAQAGRDLITDLRTMFDDFCSPSNVVPIRKNRTFPGSKNRQRIRKSLLNRDGLGCWLCGKIMPENDQTIEHLEPRSKGGTNFLGNLVLTHRLCNEKMGDRTHANKLVMRAKVQS